jgi:SCY1-like protein 1
MMIKCVQIRQKVLSHAYIRALKDPFPPARQAGILAMAATHGYFTLAECAQRILPSLCVLTTDPDKGVRDQVLQLSTSE